MSSLSHATTTTNSLRAPMMSPLLGLTCFALCASIASISIASPAHAQTGKRTAALVSYGAAIDVEPDVRAAIAELKTIALKDAKATSADVAAAAELGTTCDASSTECLASLAVLLHVDVLVVLAADASGAQELFVVDAALGKETGRTRTDVLRDAVALLLEPHLHFGTLVVRAPPSSTITIDGAAPADTEGRALVRAGRHHVAVVQEGHEPFHADAFVAAGAEVVIDAVLRPLPTDGGTPPAPAPSAPAPSAPAPSGLNAWIMAGTGAGVAVVGGAVALGIDAGLSAGLGSADEKEGYQAVGVIALVVATTGVAVAALGTAIAVLTSDS